ncbi:MAG: DUF2130 domain-containing protein [Gammaproteobacteria bacterium]|jgi:hypothetical protein
MKETIIHCPECGAEIPVSEVLGAQIRSELERSFAAEQERRLHEAVARAEARARERLDVELRDLRAQLAEAARRGEQARAAELALRRDKRELEERARMLDLEVARRLDDERVKVEAAVRQSLVDEQGLKLKEKEKQIEDLRKALADAKRRSELGSQELQGEVLEIDIQAALEQRFPQDRIAPVPRGARGADIIQWVRNERFEECGAIVWETKNTRHWQPAWLDKLKQDQRAAGGSLAVLISVALPEEVRGFGRIDGVWVSDLASWTAVALALREQLIQVAFARAASAGKNEKMELLYQYLSGDEFRQRVETIVEAFEAMQAQIHKERRAMERHWAEREKQIQRVIGSTSGMYGALQGIVGAGLPGIAALELEDDTVDRREADDDA